ncbi:MAG: M48 family metalloprotease [Acidiferrobacter sp.]
MSRAQQTAFGEAFVLHAQKTLRFVHNAEALAFVRQLGRRLVAASPDPQIHFHFYIVQSPVVNAFSVPGGYVFINSGAILATRNRDELAAVIAHEISHDTQRHIPRLIALSKKLSWAALAGMLAGVALMSSSQFEGGAAAISLSSAGLAAETLKHRRGYESEADHIGLRTMARAGFNPRAMAAFFLRLKTYNRFVSVNIPESWRTHPATDIRIAEAENLASRYPNIPIRDRPSFDRLQVTLVAAQGSPYEAQARVSEQLRGRHDPDARRYGLALVDLRLGHFAIARQTLTTLAHDAPEVVAYRLALADLALATNHYRRAIAAFEKASELRPHSVWLAVLTVRSLLTSGAINQGLKRARHLVSRHPYRVSLYRVLAHAYGLHHDYLHAHEALAEAFYLEGDVKDAQLELRLAKPFATGDAAQGRLKTLEDAIHQGWTTPPAFP